MTGEKKSIPSVSVTYARNGSSTKANAFGMRPMQERAYEKRGEQLGFNGPSQHVHAWIVAARQALRRAFANRAFCEVYR